VLQTRGIALEPAGRAVAMNYVQVVLGAGVGAAWFGEQPTLSTLAGAAIIISATIALVVADPGVGAPARR
jgi:drug/metabolite transporter (DMT)-like permease